MLDWDTLEAGIGICRRLFEASGKEYLLYVSDLFIYGTKNSASKLGVLMVRRGETNFAISFFFFFCCTKALVLSVFFNSAFTEKLCWCRM